MRLMRQRKRGLRITPKIACVKSKQAECCQQAQCHQQDVGEHSKAGETGYYLAATKKDPCHNKDLCHKKYHPTHHAPVTRQAIAANRDMPAACQKSKATRAVFHSSHDVAGCIGMHTCNGMHTCLGMHTCIGCLCYCDTYTVVL